MALVVQSLAALSVYQSPSERLTACFSAASERLGVSPILAEADVASGAADHLSMAGLL